MLRRDARGRRAAAAFFHLAGQPQPETIVLAGVGRGDEIKHLRKYMPDAKLIGVEPLDRYLQMWGGRFPGELVRGALWSSRERKRVHCNYEPDQRASLYPLLQPLTDEVTHSVDTLTLADLYAQTQPWGHTALWLDAEGSELEILKGASRDVLQNVHWMNIEMGMLPLRDCPSWRAVDRYLQLSGFEPAGMHCTSFKGTHLDWVYMRRTRWEAFRCALLDLAIQAKVERLEQSSVDSELTGR